MWLHQELAALSLSAGLARFSGGSDTYLTVFQLQYERAILMFVNAVSNESQVLWLEIPICVFSTEIEE